MTTGSDRNIEKTEKSLEEDKYSSFPSNMAEEMNKADRANEKATRGIPSESERESLYK